jgi:tRNA threonylcarbamoyladenosine biosynthesis protein TsaB
MKDWRGLKCSGFPQDWPRNCPIIPSVLILAIDTSSPAGSLAVLRDEAVIGVVATLAEENYSSRMFRHLDFLLRDLSLSLDEFDVIAIATGPGSFTGLRVGLTAAKAWAEVHGKPIAAVSGLEAVAAQARSIAPVLVPVLDARRGEVYFGFYRNAPSGLVLEGEARAATPEEFRESLKILGRDRGFCVVATVPDLLSGVLSHFESGFAEPEIVSQFLAPTIGRLGFQRAARGDLADSLTLEANYLRRSDAELNLKGMDGP